MDEAHSLPEAEGIFFKKPSGALWLLLIAGIVAFTWAVLGFIAALVLRVSFLTLHLLSTLPAMMGTAALAAAWSIARAPEEVGVGAQGVRIASRRASRFYSWEEIGWSNIHTQAMGGHRCVKLYDTRGRTFAKLSDAIGDFDDMAKLIAKRIAAKEGDTADRVRRIKKKQQAVLMGCMGLLFLALAIGLLWDTSNKRRENALLQTAAVPGEAQIEDRFLAPDRVTTRLIYRMTTPEGVSVSRNAEVTRPVWEALARSKTVAVLYVPDEPSISRLAAGEVPPEDLSDNPVIGYGLPAVAGVMGLIFVGLSPFVWCGPSIRRQWLGWNIWIDFNLGKVSINRLSADR